MKFQNYLIALLLAAASLQSTESPTIAEFAFMIRWERPYTGNSPPEEAARQSWLLKHIVNLIPDYGKHETLEPAITFFLREHFAEDYRIVNARSTPLFGKSKDDVFYIQDVQGTTLYVVKAFRNPETLGSMFLPELSAMTLLQDLKLTKLKGVKPLRIGKCQAGALPYGLLLESLAPGKLVYQYILEIGLAQEPARSLAIQKVARMFHVIGQAFAQLHKKHAELSEPFPEDLKQKMRQKLAALDSPEVQAKLEGKIDQQALSRYAEKVIDEAAQVPMVPCFQHGDPHWKNVFYDEEKELVTLIDVGKLHRSVDIEGKPLSDGTYDLVRVQESLVRNSLRLLTAAEVQKLIDALHKGYRSQGGIAQPAHIHFHTIYSKISRLSSYADYDRIEDPIESTRNRLTFENSLQALQEAVKQ
ncbi:MAG: aminoglycoside phosphotransferase family protein [Parachlamydia sp.]|nr:aminoglycoside phosphotransferase family protein [Parachlamydia sp.]